MPSSCEDVVAVDPVHQAHPELRLERVQLAPHRRLRHVQVLGRGREDPVADQFQEEAPIKPIHPDRPPRQTTREAPVVRLTPSVAGSRGPAAR